MRSLGKLLVLAGLIYVATQVVRRLQARTANELDGDELDNDVALEGVTQQTVPDELEQLPVRGKAVP